MAPTFSVVSEKPELIVPAKFTPHEIKAVSVIDDQETLRIHYPIIMFYKNSHSMEGMDPVKVIRQALAKALVYYYPFAGRLIEGPDNKLMVDCTAEGVVFVEADAGVSLEQLSDTVQPPCAYPELLLHVPGSDGIIGCPLMLVQVTRFKCRGFALAIQFNHVISDALGSYQFVSTMSEMAKGASTPPILPLWERDLFTTRQPPRIEHMHPEYEIDSRSVIPPSMDDKNLVRKSFSFGPEEIKAIGRKLPPECRSASKFDLITACLWRSRSRALQFDPEDNLRITCTVNMRGKNFINIPLGYYGNAVIHPAKVSKAKTLFSSPLGHAIKLVKEARTQATEEYSRSVIDYLATEGRPKVTNPWNFVVSDLSKIGFDEVDFGGGKAVYGGTMDGGTFNYAVYSRYRNRKGEDAVVVAMALPIAVMERFENELRRLIWEPMEGSNYSTPVMAYSKL